MPKTKRSRGISSRDFARTYGRIREYESATSKYQRELEEYQQKLDDMKRADELAEQRLKKEREDRMEQQENTTPNSAVDVSPSPQDRAIPETPDSTWLDTYDQESQQVSTTPETPPEDTDEYDFSKADPEKVMNRIVDLLKDIKFESSEASKLRNDILEGNRKIADLSASDEKPTFGEVAWKALGHMLKMNNVPKQIRVWGGDAISYAAVKKNETEIESALGEIVRAKEKQNYLYQYDRFLNNMQTLTELQKEADDYFQQANNGIPGAKEKYLKIKDDIRAVKQANDLLIPELKEASTYGYELPEYDTPKSYQVTQFGYIPSMGGDNNQHKALTVSDFDAALDTYSKMFDQNGNVVTSDLRSYINGQKGKINQYSDYVTNRVIPDARNSIDVDLKDLADWAKIHNVSESFKEKAERAASDMKFLSLDTYTHGIWSVLGSSASNNGLQLISQALKMGGAAASSTGKGALIGVPMTLAGGAFGMMSAEAENNAEVGSNFKEAFKARLQANNLYDKFLKDGRKQIGKDATEEEVMRAALLEDYIIKDYRIQEQLETSMYGANNFFQDDMAATFGSEIVEMGLGLFVPGAGKVSGAMLRAGGKYSPGTLLRYWGMKHPGAKAFTNYATNVLKSEAGYAVGGTISPVAGMATAALSPLVGAAAKKVFNPITNQALKNFTFMQRWMRNAPGKYAAKVGAAKKTAAFIGTELGMSFSEAIEEGKQHIHGEEFKRGEYKGDKRSLFDTIMGDLSAGSRAAYTFIGDQFFGLNSDPSLMAEMRSGFLAPYGNVQAAVPVISQFGEIYKQYKADEMVGVNLLAMKLSDNMNIQNAIQYARIAQNPDKIRTTLNAFDKMIEIHERLAQTAKDKGDDSFAPAFTREDIEAQRKQFYRIMNAANSEQVNAAARSVGIETGGRFKKPSDQFYTFVALQAYSDDLAEVAQNGINQFSNHIQHILNAIGSLQNDYQSLTEDAQINMMRKALTELGLEGRVRIKPKQDSETTYEYQQRAQEEYISEYNRIINDHKAKIRILAELRALYEMKEQLENVVNPTKAQKEELKQYESAIAETKKEITQAARDKYGLDGNVDSEYLDGIAPDADTHQTLSKLFRQLHKYNFDFAQALQFKLALVGKENIMSRVADNPYVQNTIQKIYDSAKESKEATEDLMENEDFVESVRLSKNDKGYVVKTDKKGEEYREYFHTPIKSKQLPNSIQEKSGHRIYKALSIINRYEETVKKDQELVQMLWDDYYAALEQRDKEREAELNSTQNQETPATAQTAAAETNETLTVGNPEDDPIDPEHPVGSQPEPEEVPQPTPVVNPPVQPTPSEEPTQAEPEVPVVPPTPPTPPAPPTPPVPPSNDDQFAVSTTPEQQRIVDQIRAKIAADKDRVQHTGRDYFVEENGHLVRYNRVHSVLEEQFPTGPKRKEDIQEIMRNLRSVFSDKKRYKQGIEYYQNRYNEALEKLYGKDSEMYNQYKIDLSLYWHDDIITDESAIESVANIAAIGNGDARGLSIPKRSALAGSIVDEIAREVFSGRTIVYDPKYKMPESVFNRIVSEMKARKAEYERQGFVLIADDINWRSTLSVNGKVINVAGNTDMIAVDKQGHIKIVDFKTSRSSFEQLRYKDETGGIVRMYNVLDQSEVPAGSETEIFNEALDRQYDSANFTAREQYRHQLTMYMMLIQNQAKDGYEVTSMEILPFWIRVREGVNPVSNQREGQILEGFVSNTEETYDHADGQPRQGGRKAIGADYIEMQQPIPLDPDDAIRSKVLNISEVRKTAEIEPLEFAKDEVINFMQILENFLNSFGHESDYARSKFITLRNHLQDFINRYNELMNDEAKRSEQSAIDEFTNEAVALLNEAKDVESIFLQESQKYQQDLEDDKFVEDPTFTSSRFLPHELMAKGGGNKFSRIWVNNMMTRQGAEEFARLMCEPDFLNSAVVELDVDYYLKSHGTSALSNGMTVLVNIKYKQHEIKGVKLLLQTEDVDGNTIEQRNGQLIKAIDSILYTVDEKTGRISINEKNRNKRIILTGASRTNGETKYGSTLRNIQDVFKLSDSEVADIASGIQKGILGVVARGSVRKIVHNSKEPAIGIHPIEQGRELQDGMVVYEMFMGYDEDGQDTWKHQVPILLTPKSLTENDANLIIDCLKHYTKRRKLTVNGQEVDCPLTNRQILHSLIRFGAAADRTGNKFRFNWAHVDEHGVPLDHKSVIISGLQGENDKIYTVDLDNAGQVEWLRQHLQNAFVYYDNEYGMWHNTSQAKDQEKTHRFYGLEDFFKAHPDVDQIKISDSMVFDRSDVDPEGNGTYSGISGVHWMIKHGWMQTNFDHMEMPLVSFSDAQVVDEHQDHVEQQMSTETQDVNDQQVTGQTIVEEGSLQAARDEALQDNDQDDDSDNAWGVYHIGIPRKEGSLDKDVALRHIRHILGKNFPVEFIDDVIGIADHGETILAVMRAACITLSTQTEDGTEFHEAFHGVVEFLIGEKRRQKLFEHYRNRYGHDAYGNRIDLTDRDVTEGLADLFWQFRTNAGSFFSLNILDTFKNIARWVKAISSLNDRKIARLFVEASLGRFRLVSSKKAYSEEAIQRFIDRYKYLYHTVKNAKGEEIKLKNFANATQVDDALNALLYMIMSRSGIDVLGQNIGNLKTDYTSLRTRVFANSQEKKRIAEYDKEETHENPLPNTKYFNSIIGEGMSEEQFSELPKHIQRNIRMMRELFEHWDIFQPMLEAKIETATGVRSKRERQKKQRDNVDGATTSQVSEDIEGHADEFYNHSLSDDVAGPIRFFLSTIPALRYATAEDVEAGRLDYLGRPLTGITSKIKDKKGNVITVRNRVIARTNSLGMPSFMPYQQVYQTLLKLFYNCKNVADLDAKLQAAAQNDYMMEHIAKCFHNFRFKSYIRYSTDEFSKIPIVFLNGQKVDPHAYIRDVKNPTQNELFMTQVRAVKDLYDGDKLICREGEIIPGALIATNPDYESFTTQMFQAIKSQRLDFTFCFDKPVVDENGRNLGGHTYDVSSTNSEQAQKNYPHQWFGIIKALYGQVFTGQDKSEVKVFGEAKDFLTSLMTQLSAQHLMPITLPGRKGSFDISNIEHFDLVCHDFVACLNSIGIMIDRQMLNYMLMQKYPNIKEPYMALKMMFQSRDVDSIYPLIQKDGVLDKLQNAMNSRDYGLFLNDYAKRKDREDSGSFLYANNGFVKSMALWYGRYRAASQDMMVLGPENTKMYMFAQNHTISDMVYDLNQAQVDENGNVSGSETLSDLKDVEFVSYIDKDQSRRGSVIVKSLMDPTFNPKHDKLKLSTSSGIKRVGSRDGGTKYAKMTAREDWINKAEILANGHIIFPTLSDKSTWFYLNGIKLPGFDWSDRNSSSLSTENLLYFGLRSGRMFFSNKDTRGAFESNEQLDQLIEYAYCDYRNALYVWNQLKNNLIPEEKKVKNFHTGNMNGARLSFLFGIYDENDKFISFNNNKKTPEECLQKAAEEFFMPKEVTVNGQTRLETDQELKARQRYLISRILQHRLDEQLDDLVKKGIIEEMKITEANKNLPRYLRYKNKYLDDSKIKYLASLYARKDRGDGTLFGDETKGYKPSQLESLAIVAYVNDVNVKSIMSTQETRAIFTGMPHFFKWQYNENGDLVDARSDETKRYGGAGSTGTNNRDDLPNIETEYTCAEINDWEVASPVVKALGAAFMDNEYRDALVQLMLAEEEEFPVYNEGNKEIYEKVYSMSIEDVKKEIELIDKQNKNLDKNGNSKTLAILQDKAEAETKSFEEEINVADGTAFITDKMAENLLRQRGAYTYEVSVAFDYLRGDRKVFYKDKEGKSHKGHYLTDYEAYKTIYNALISTQKYSAFGYRMEYGIPVHFYNKFALFPVFKGMSYGLMYDLYEKMNDKEGGADMVMFTSAVKSGSEGAQTFNPDHFRKNDDPADEQNFVDGDVANQNWKPANYMKDFTFKGRTYKQKYKFIRRQLNTDPREEEEMPVGTQAAKVILSTLRDDQTYTDHNGNKILGKDLKNKIMQHINALSEIGLDRIRDKFIKDGKLNIEQFSKYIKEELLRRGADRNILDAIEVVYEKDADGNNIEGSGRFRCCLNSVSNMSWIESIIISKINSEIIDINLPGNAFYQRSVFGMEGAPYSIMSEENAKRYTINGGRPLQMINEDGSMDAVVSYDYFMHLVPAKIRYNFEKGRQWLIDNGIIGPNAKANTVAYRIPTQAASSIHALRFVDVIPIVRDTIILPKEFTKITGSDFDIDKLYLSSIVYETDKNGNLKDIADYEFENSIKNSLMHYWIMLLEDAGKSVYTGRSENEQKTSMGRYMHILHRSIDNDTSLVKNVLKKLEGKSEQKEESMSFGSLSTQVNIKDALITGKFGIGPFALNNNSQILTQLYNVSFRHINGGILTEMNRESLSNYTDKNGDSILSWISALINAHVDVAKDPYILRMNVNQYTWNILNLLIRTGFGDDSFYYINQPIFKDLATVYANANGTIVDDPGLSPTDRWKKALSEYINGYNFSRDGGDARNNGRLKFMFDPNSNKDEVALQHRRNMPIYKALFNIDEKGNYLGGQSILEKVLTDPNMRKNPDKPVSMDNLRNDKPLIEVAGQKLTPLEVQMFAVLAKQCFDEYAEALSEVVTVTKIDTKKQGISFLEQQEYKARYDKVFKDAKDSYMGGDTESLFDGNLYLMLRDSFINEKTENAIPLLKEILGTELIHFTDTFQEAMLQITERLNNRTVKTKKAVQNALLAYIKQKCMNKYMSEHNISFRDMIYGNNTLITRIIALRNKMMSDKTGKYSDYVTNGTLTNILLANLSKVPYTIPYGQEAYDLIDLENAQQDDEDFKDIYISDWQQLWESEDPEIHQIAHDLAIYAFMTSADTAGFTKFFRYVPLDIRDAIGYTQNMERVKNAFVEGRISITPSKIIDDDIFNIDIEEVIRNNWRNNDIVPSFDMWESYFDYESGHHSMRKKVIGTYLTYQDIDNTDSLVTKTDVFKMFAGIMPSGRGWRRTISQSKRTGNFPLFVKVRRSASVTDSDQYQLYQLVGVGVKNTTDKEGRPYRLEYPIYAITYPKGFEVNSGSQRYTMYEYGRDDNYKHIFDKDYFLSSNYQEWLNEQLDRITQYVESQEGEVKIDEASISQVVTDEDGNSMLGEEISFLIDMWMKDHNLNPKQDQIPFGLRSLLPGVEFYSGAAEGSDKYWAEKARAIGIKVKDYTPQDWDYLSQDQKDKINEEYTEVVNILGRNILFANSYAGKLVRRDMMQADSADAIFAISTVTPNGFVSGGTAYAATRGMLRGIPVYVFDQNTKAWFVGTPDGKVTPYIDDNNEPLEPTLTPHAAVIGTRGLNNDGKKAIDNVLSKWTSNNISSEQQNQQSITDQIIQHINTILQSLGLSVKGKSDIEQFFKDHQNAFDIIQRFIGRKARTRFEQQLRKARPDMTNEEIQATLDFLHSLEDNKENTAYIKTAIRWVANKSITLPQDNEKARQAFDFARKKNIDLQKYNTLGELIASPEMMPKEKQKPKFDPDTAKTFSNKRTVTTENGRVFTVYDVENTEEGQREVCKALKANYKMSPWCLSTFTATGEPTASAKRFWEEYNGIPRKIAFEHGKPVAFSSNRKEMTGGWHKIEGKEIYVMGEFLVTGETVASIDSSSLSKEEADDWVKKGYIYPNLIYNRSYQLTTKGIDAFEKQASESWWDMEDQRPQPKLSDEIISHNWRIDGVYQETPPQANQEDIVDAWWEDGPPEMDPFGLFEMDVTNEIRRILNERVLTFLRLNDLVPNGTNEYWMRNELVERYFGELNVHSTLSNNNYVGTSYEIAQQILANNNTFERIRRTISEDITNLPQPMRPVPPPNIGVPAVPAPFLDNNFDEDIDLPFFMTPEGEVYGFVDKDGNIYIDETIISPEHPIHEYTHLWDRIVARRNPELWKKGVELMKQTSLWNEVINSEQYGKRWKQLKGMTPEKLEQLIASEVHARLVGEGGEKLLNKLAKEKGQEGIIDKLKQWILDVWKDLKSTFSKFSDEELSKLTLKDFNRMTVRDFANAVNFTQTSIKDLISNASSLEEAQQMLEQNGFDINSDVVQQALGEFIKKQCK